MSSSPSLLDKDDDDDDPVADGGGEDDASDEDAGEEVVEKKGTCGIHIADMALKESDSLVLDQLLPTPHANES